MSIFVPLRKFRFKRVVKEIRYYNDGSAEVYKCWDFYFVGFYKRIKNETVSVK